MESRSIESEPSWPRSGEKCPSVVLGQITATVQASLVRDQLYDEVCENYPAKFDSVKVSGLRFGGGTS